jgi:cytochrome c553
MRCAAWPAFGSYVHLLVTALLGFAAALGGGSLLAADEKPGKAIYRDRCASCHGMSGEGTAESYPRPLAGERSVAQLARLIARTMPKDADEKCSAQEAQQVAAYIYDTFYSKAAQERNRPPRVELSRLTVPQYRNAVADLIGSFRSPGRWDEQHGLRGAYFKSFGLRSNNRVLERVDPAVRFDFGEASPDAKIVETDRFGIRWEGSILAPETGEYEFKVRTEHASRLWINDTKKPLIDAWVQSGNETEHRASIFLVGGRAYPLKLEFAKGKQGVQDNEKKEPKPKPVKASVALEWKLPHSAQQVVPSRKLSPNRFPETLVVTAPFPADDRSMGYERGTSISKAWDQATTDAAIEVAGYVMAHLAELAGTIDGAADRPQRLRDFCKRFAERALRRPLTPELQRFFVDRHFETGKDLETQVKRVVLLVLKSPRFLYREAGGSPDAYDVASRIAFALWDSPPDQELLEAAAKGRLTTREQVVSQVQRMLGDLRARAKLRGFFLQWLKVDPAPDLAKDPKQFPSFDPSAAADLRTSLELFLEDVIWSETSDFRELLLADYLYLNGRLAPLYGADLSADAPFRKITPKPGERAGVLSHPYLMATFAYTSTSSPIHRGVFLARSVLGQMLRPPPDAFTPLPPELHPQLTTRERVTLQTKPQACVTCHGMINSLGFALENFDALGRFRDKEKDRPVDATGSYQTRSGKTVQFRGLRDLATFLAESPETHEAFVERLFHYMVKQPIRAFGSTEPLTLQRSFADNRYSIRKLVVEIVADSAMTAREEKRKTTGPTASGASAH